MPALDLGPPSEAARRIDNARLVRRIWRDIAPELPALEAYRRQRLSRLRIRMALIALALSACAALALMLILTGVAYPRTDWLLLGGVAMLMLLAALASNAKANEAFVDRVRDTVMPTVCRHVGEIAYRSDAFADSLPDKFRENAMVHDYGWADLRGEFHGCREGTAFRMVGGRLLARRKSNAVEGFVGVFLAIKVSAPFSGRTHVGRNGSHRRNRWAERGVKRFGFHWIPFDDPPFEEIFKVYAYRAQEARRLLSPVVRNALVVLERASRGRTPAQHLRAAFVDGEFLLAMPSRSTLFWYGALRRPVAEIEVEMDRIISEATIAHRVIDLLRGDRPDWA